MLKNSFCGHVNFPYNNNSCTNMTQPLSVSPLFPLFSFSSSTKHSHMEPRYFHLLWPLRPLNVWPLAHSVSAWLFPSISWSLHLSILQLLITLFPYYSHKDQELCDLWFPAQHTYLKPNHRSKRPEWSKWWKKSRSLKRINSCSPQKTFTYPCVFVCSVQEKLSLHASPQPIRKCRKWLFGYHHWCNMMPNNKASSGGLRVRQAISFLP